MMLWILLAAVAVFVAVIAIRTAAFKPKPQPTASGEVPEFDREKAVDALRAEAPGILFLDTADYVLLTGGAEDCMEKLQDYVRPGTRVYKLEGTAELSEIGPFLKTHGPDAPLYRLQKGKLQLPKLTAEGEKLRFEGP